MMMKMKKLITRIKYAIEGAASVAGDVNETKTIAKYFHSVYIF